MKKTFHLLTHGCKVNQYESEAIAEAWKAAGFREVEAAEADILVLVSCAVTAKAATAARRSLKSLHALNPSAELVFTGCAAALPDFRHVEEVNAVFTPAQKDLLLQYPDYAARSLPVSALAHEKNVWPEGSVLARGNNPGHHDRADHHGNSGHPDHSGQSGPSAHAGLDDIQSGGKKFPAFKLGSRQRSRATLKIQDGCSHGCAYCIVPLTRGPSRSREFTGILEEAQALLKAGLRELVISGINLRQFKPGLWQLIDYLEQELPPFFAELQKEKLEDERNKASGKAPGNVHGKAPGEHSPDEKQFAPADKIRLRLSSLDPSQLDERALDSLSRSRLLAPHLHLSLQSGSAATLQRMRRTHYQPENILHFLQKVRTIWPDFALGADILLGFPGESEQEFSDTMDFIKALPLSYAHVFPYSKRPGTLAATYPDQVKRELAKERAGLVRMLAEQKKTAFLENLFHKQLTQEVVFELRPTNAKNGVGELKGISQFYADCLLTNQPAAPTESTGSTGQTGPAEKISAIIPCKISGIKDNMLLTKPL